MRIKISVALTVAIMTLSGAYFVWGIDADVKMVDHRLEEVERTQQKVVDWLDVEIQKRRSIDSQQRLLRYLCQTGKLTGDDCKGIQVIPPDSTEQP